MPQIPVEQIDLAFLKAAFPTNTSSELIPWIEPLKAACQEYGIDTVREIASFFANISVESGDLKVMSESLNYSVASLLSLFSRARISTADAQRLGRKPGEPALSQERQRQLANILYGGEFGRKNLGNTMPDDGWTFRGYGPKQLTGRSNHTKFAASIGKPLAEATAYMRTREGGARAAGWFWLANDMDTYAATPGVEDDRKHINGGLNGVDQVRTRFNELVKLLLARGC